MDTDYAKIQTDVRSLVEDLSDRIPPEQLSGMRSAANGGDWADALEHLCATLTKRQIAIQSTHRDALAAVLDAFGWEHEEFYYYINHKATTIASLNVDPQSQLALRPPGE